MKLFIALMTLALANPAFSVDPTEVNLRHLLNAEQRVKADKILMKYQPEFRAMLQELKVKTQSLLTRGRNPGKGTGYQKELTDQFSELITLRHNLAMKRFELRLQVRELLSKEQLSKLQIVPNPYIRSKQAPGVALRAPQNQPVDDGDEY